jgi:carbon monoxide dehydrogenase subunit G
MASILKEIHLDAPPHAVWSAVRDIGAVHRRLAPGFVTDVRLEENARVVTFANGAVVREMIVSIDDRTRRLAYAATGGRASHHNASMQVLENADGSTRLLWHTDVLPDDIEGVIRGMVDSGVRAIEKAFGSNAPSTAAAHGGSASD